MSGPGGIVRPDGEPENGAHRVRESFSVGQLIAIRHDRRAAIVDAMPHEQRVALAELAQLGLARELDKVDEYTNVLRLLLRDRAGAAGA